MSLKRAAFTLIELLVVISIIAILSAMLFPVFLAARTAVFRYGAGNDLRQVGMVASLYGQDFDDSLPPYRVSGWWGPNCPITACANPDYRKDSEKYGSQAQTWYGENVRDSMYFSQMITPYLKNPRTFYSKGQINPWAGADKQGNSFHDPKNRSYGAQNSYALNWYLFTNPVDGLATGGGLSQSQVDGQSSTVLMLDGSFYLALPRHAGPLLGNYDQTSAVCTGNYPHYWKNIGNSQMFSRQGLTSDDQAMRLGPMRYGGTLVMLNLDGSTKNRTYDAIITNLRGGDKDSYWDPFKQGHEPCAPIAGR